jgi:hypothetical protein
MNLEQFGAGDGILRSADLDQDLIPPGIGQRAGNQGNLQISQRKVMCIAHEDRFTPVATSLSRVMVSVTDVPECQALISTPASTSRFTGNRISAWHRPAKHFLACCAPFFFKALARVPAPFLYTIYKEIVFQCVDML